MSSEKRTCCICGDEFTGWNHTLAPLYLGENGDCCERCSLNIVWPVRVLINKELEKRGKEPLNFRRKTIATKLS